MILIKKLGRRKNKTGKYFHSWGLFSCSYCGEDVERYLGNGKKYTSCGCNWIKHGEAGSRLYKIWLNMKERCLNPNESAYKNYGERGITICNEWLKYINFRDWALNNGYKDDLTIDRENNNGNYEPNNCRFVTLIVNNQNRRSIKLNLEKVLEIRKKYDSSKYTYKQLSEEYGVGHASICDIINNKSWKGELERGDR